MPHLVHAAMGAAAFLLYAAAAVLMVRHSSKSAAQLHAAACACCSSLLPAACTLSCVAALTAVRFVLLLLRPKALGTAVPNPVARGLLAGPNLDARLRLALLQVRATWAWLSCWLSCCWLCVEQCCSIL